MKRMYLLIGAFLLGALQARCQSPAADGEMALEWQAGTIDGSYRLATATNGNWRMSAGGHPATIRWQARQRVLSGSNWVTAGVSNLLAITLPSALQTDYATVALTMVGGYQLENEPGAGLVARPDDAYNHANTPDAPFSMLYQPVREGECWRMGFTSGTSGQISWQIRFSGKPER